MARVNDHLATLPAQGVTSVVVSPIGFVSDHLEVVWDLDTEERLLADDDTDREGRAMGLGPRGAWIAWETARGKVSRLATKFRVV